MGIVLEIIFGIVVRIVSETAVGMGTGDCLRESLRDSLGNCFGDSLVINHGNFLGDSLESCRRESFGVVFRGILEIFLRLVWRTVVGLVFKLWNVFGLVLWVVRRWS
jgi:hypothetical protein